MRGGHGCRPARSPKFIPQALVLLPAFAANGDPEEPCVVRVLVDHVRIRAQAQRLERESAFSTESLHGLGTALERHVRLEEREVFGLIAAALPHDAAEAPVEAVLRGAVAVSADLLAQSTRRRLFALFAKIGGSASTGRLAARLAMHPNGVRTHLARMEAAGLVVRRRVPQARGRPRDEWAVSPAARATGDELEAYRALVRWLARAVPATPRRLRDVERTGVEIGRELALAASAAPEQVVEDILAALGFQPQVHRRPGGRLSCRLRSCPYSDSVRQNQPVGYPDAREGLNRWLPLVRWLLAIPHYVVLALLCIGVFFAVIAAWLAILFTGRYPRGIFDYVEGVARWHNRVVGYAVILVTDRYPPFRLRP